MDTEIWKSVVGWEWLYEVSSLWRVKSLWNFKNRKEKLLKLFTIHEYILVNLNNKWMSKNIFLHRIIAQAFIPNTENKRCVNHINGIKNDYRICNLEWCTHSENAKHAFLTKLRYTTANNNFVKLSKTVLQFSLKWELIKEWESINNASKTLNIDTSSICNCLSWKYKHAWWFFWKYK